LFGGIKAADRSLTTVLLQLFFKILDALRLKMMLGLPFGHLGFEYCWRGVAESNVQQRPDLDRHREE
jgi:hypothetical protein